MDFEKRARRQSLRVIVSETIMVATVIIMVIILALIVSGYWLGSDFKVERQGMLQVSSIPTGADVTLDGNSSWFQRTNTSKVLSSGEHSVVLSKDGYDSWSKTVQIREGLLYRLQYPRLFREEREKSTYYSIEETSFATISPSHKYLVMANNTTSWILLNLENDRPEPKTIDVSKLFTAASKIEDAWWSGDNQHLLVKGGSASGIEWVLLDINKTDNSLNITREFAANFSDVKIFDNSANNLLVIRNGNLHRIDVSGRQISAVLADNVYHYSYYDNEIIYVSDSGIGILKNGETTPIIFNATELAEEADAAPTFGTNARAFLSRFYDDKYIDIITDNTIMVFARDTGDEVMRAELSFNPEQVKPATFGDFIFMSAGDSVAALDMESHSVSEWTIASPDFGWLDSHMIYNIADGVLSVYDYDGLNHRTLSSEVSAGYPVTITGDKWLYYFSDGKIIRETVN